MSRQNLTQRLKRDNFPEQDMHIIAALLGYQVSVQLNPISIPVPEFMRPELSPAAFNPPFPQIPSQTRSSAVQKTEPSETNMPVPPDTKKENLEDADQITFQIPEAFRKNKPQGEINPLTGEEYLTNTVRRHPDLEEFVQVYDQTTHSWSDVREVYLRELQDK